MCSIDKEFGNSTRADEANLCSFALPARYRGRLTRRTAFSIIELPCGCSSAGRAPASQAEGHGFESRHPLSTDRAHDTVGVFVSGIDRIAATI